MSNLAPEPADHRAPPSPLQMVMAFSKAGLGSASTLLVMAVMNKIVAVIGGPSTLGLFSLLRQAELTGIAIASSDGDKALVQGISARRGEPEEPRYIWNIGALMLAITLAEAVLLWISAPWLSQAIFEAATPGLVWAVRLVGLPVLLAVGSTWLIAILKSHLAIGRAVLVRTIGAAAGCMAAFFAARDGGPVPLITILLASEGIGLVTAWVFARGARVLPRRPAWSVNQARADGRAYLSVAGFLLLTGIIRNIAVMIIRTLFLRDLGMAYAGFFEAAWTVAGKSLLFLLDAIGTYYLPLLSAARDAAYRPQLLRRLTRLAWATGTLAVAGLVVLKPLAVTILYSGDFLESLVMLQWMIVGIYFQACSWPFTTAMIAFGDVRYAFRVDASWLAIFLTGSAISLVVMHEPAGAGVAYLVASAVMLASTVIVVVRRYALAPSRRMVITWLLGLAVVVGASWATWGQDRVDWLNVLVWVALAGVVAAASLQPEERRAILDRLTGRHPPS
jgi:O-antigen/teichoic acid export membrane protein